MSILSLINAVFAGSVYLALCSPVAGCANAPKITMVSCSIYSPTKERNVEQSVAYCEALVQYLNADLDTQFEIAPSGWVGTLLNVDIRLENEHVAVVHLESGSIDAERFSAEDSLTSKLVSYDRPISPFTLRALVRDIGSLLGILKQ